MIKILSLFALKGWSQALSMLETGDGSWALFAKSVLDRTRLALAGKGELYNQLLQPSAEYLGARLNLDQWAVRYDVIILLLFLLDVL